MEIEIKRLAPALAKDYVRFFDVTPHDDRSDKSQLPCYCVTWRGDAAYAKGEPHFFPSREERRERALRYVKEGHIQGYLAYYQGRVVGWCNANGNCGACLLYLRSFWPIENRSEDVRVKSIFCFMIAPEMQRKGIATKLLERVCEDAAAEGFDYAEGYAHTPESTPPYDFAGPIAMYEKCGFVNCGEKDGRAVMRKALK